MTSGNRLDRVAAMPLVSVVVIGRNEGPRLMACLDSIEAVHGDSFRVEVIYVDSDSSDGSPEQAAERGVQVIRVKPLRPSAALGRNAGWRAAQGEFVLFLDGDTQLHPDFVRRALAELGQPEVAIVWGHRRESHPEQSLYVRVLDLDWIYPPGDSEFCGGDALMRRRVLDQVQGFDEGLIAGEEPEMCRRIRQQGYRIVHIDAPMTQHDLAVTRFSAYWRRAFRAGHAYAEVSSRFRHTPDPLWLNDSRRNWVRGGVLLLTPGVLLGLTWLLPLGWGIGLWGGGLVTAVAVLARSARRCAWKSSDQATCWWYALHSQFQQIPIFCGQLMQRWDAWRGRQRGLIEYKSASPP